jgi:ubiquinone/menaquinone biosynthesis C-methylase UbiE
MTIREHIAERRPANGAVEPRAAGAHGVAHGALDDKTTGVAGTTSTPSLPGAPAPGDGASATASATASAAAGADQLGEKSFSFEWFSSLAAYREANRQQLEAFLGSLRLAPPWQGVDVACGVGLMAELTHEIANKLGSFIQRIVCVDLDGEAIQIAREKLARSPVDFIQALGQRLPLRDGWGSFLTIGNGIHNFGAAEKTALFKEGFRVLRDEASLFFNSAFYDGALVPGTERFYTEQVRRALRYIGRGAPQAEGERPEAAKPITAAEYVHLAHAAGFADVEQHEVQVKMDQELWEAISSYGPYAQGALHYRYPVEVAVKALVQAVRDVFEDPDWDAKFPGMTDNGKRFIPRQWLWVTAHKPGLA